MSNYRTLAAWKAAHAFAIAVAQVTKSFPRDERYELTSQLRRAALSAPANLAEGQGRFGHREALRYTRIAAGSLAEADYLLVFAYECGYLSRGELKRLVGLRRRASVLAHRLARALDRQNA